MTDSSWKSKYKKMITSSKEAVKHINPGHRVFISTGAAQPINLVDEMAKRGDELVDTEIVHMLTLGHAPYADKKFINNFRVNSFFISNNVRGIIQEGLGDYTPIFLSDIPKLFSSSQLPVDVALIQVTPPDKDGMCSLGISVDIVKSAVENAKLVVAQVNDQMPVTKGDSLINIYDLDWLVDDSEPLFEAPPTVIDDEKRKIGEFVAALVEDESTIEFGIGGIPQAVIPFLKDKKHLGIHTEMFTDELLELVEKGVIDGSRKSRDKGKIVASFCMGSKKLYDYIDNNDKFAFYPTEYVNDPMVIASQHKQVAINVALEVDLTGQVCADSLTYSVG